MFTFSFSQNANKAKNAISGGNKGTATSNAEGKIVGQGRNSQTRGREQAVEGAGGQVDGGEQEAF